MIKITNRGVFKTKLCNRAKQANGVCQRGSACWYAHSQDELRKPDQDVESYMEARGITNYVIIDGNEKRSTPKNKGRRQQSFSDKPK